MIDTTSLHEATFVMRLPWQLADSLKGAKRDSALKFNLTRLDGEVRQDDGRTVRVYRFVRGNMALGRTRLAHPDSAGMVFPVRRRDVRCTKCFAARCSRRCVKVCRAKKGSTSRLRSCDRWHSIHVWRVFLSREPISRL